jgi:hypothetical protein
MYRTERGQYHDKKETQLTIIIATSLIIVAFTWALYIYHPLSFQRFFGKINPLIITSSLSILGMLILLFFLSKNGFEVFSGLNFKRMGPFYSLAIFLASIAIVIDIFFTYPEDTHIIFPYSLLFYPVMGYVVEMLFHLIPLCLLLLLMKSIFKKSSPEKLLWLCILIISLIEPTFQTAMSPRYFPLYINVYMWIHLFVFNFLQLLVFKRFDFIKMYLFRLVYYLLWHIVWGSVRGGVLFP